MVTDKDTVSLLFASDPAKGKKVRLFSVWMDLLFGGL